MEQHKTKQQTIKRDKQQKETHNKTNEQQKQTNKQQKHWENKDS